MLNKISERLFGPPHNTNLSGLLLELADTALGCVQHLKKTRCRDLQGIVDFEHRGDGIESKVQEILDNAFILRFDKGDVAHLASALDDAIDGTRRIAKHVHLYAPHLDSPRSESMELLDLIVSMVENLRSIVATLSSSHLPQQKIRTVVTELMRAEAEADEMLEKAELALVAEFDAPGKSTLIFFASDKLLRLLERITDSVEHAGKLILSMARKEA